MKLTPFLLLVLLTLPLALAESGCFIEKDSSFYCQTIDKEQAAEECQTKQCNLEKSFLPNTPCTPETFPECEQILCKSSCQLDFAGNCRSGSIPEEQKQEWCTPVCCAYLINDKITCTSQFRQGICESHAKNKNLNTYYTFPAEKQQCQTICETKINTLEDLDTNDFLKHPLSTSSAQQNTTLTTLKTKSTTSETTNKSSEQSSSTGIIFFFLLIFGASVAYFIYTQKKINFKFPNPLNTTQPKPSPPFEPKPTLSITPLNLSTTPQSQALKHLHQTKVKQHERRDFFHTFGQFATIAQYEGSHLKTLKNIIELYERKKLTIPQNLTPKEKKALDLLQDLVSKTKQQPPSPPSIQKTKPTLSPAEKKKKQELDDVLNALRQISKNS